MAVSLQINFRQKPYLFQFKLGFSILCLFFLVLFCLLGTWQVHRYQYKKNLLSTYQNHQATKPVPLSTLRHCERSEAIQSGASIDAALDCFAALAMTNVIVEGKYHNDMNILIQNRFYKNQLGYEVLTPLQMTGEKKLLLVNRGWIPFSSAPKIDPVMTHQKIIGYIKLLNEHQFILGKNILEPNHYPLVIQKVDVNEISQITHKDFFPFVLRLNADQPNGFVRDWVITTVEPQRHLGYAIQWFLMAAVLFIAYFCFCYEREKKL